MSEPDLTPSSGMAFSDRQWLRYTRHLQLPQTGVEGQQRLQRARVLIVGAGGLGSPVSLYLAAAGVGHITIVDGDTVDLTNLQRQILFTTEQVGQPKAACARQRLLALNDEITVTAVSAYLSPETVAALFDGVDLVLDCTDNFATRYLINDTCVQKKIPWIFASVFQFSGQCALFTPQTACFRCLFPGPPTDVADCNAAGVFGVLPGLLGSLQASETIKYLTGLECPLESNLLVVEALDFSFRKIHLAKNPQCPGCSDQPSAIDVGQYALPCSLNPASELEISAATFRSYLQESEKPQANCVVVDVRTNSERAAFHLGGEHIPLDNLRNGNCLPKDYGNKKIVCYCQSGIRGLQAVGLFRAMGRDACSLEGGIVNYLQWRQR